MSNKRKPHRARTLKDWMELYLVSSECPKSAKANLPGIFRRFAELINGVPDPDQVFWWDAGGLLNAWEKDLTVREDQGEIRKASARNYMTWGRKAIWWAVNHLKGRDIHTQPSILVESDPQHHLMLAHLKELGAKNARQKVKLFLKWLEKTNQPLDALKTKGKYLMRTYAHEVLEKSGINTWKASYGDLRRGILALQKVGYLPEFEVYEVKKLLSKYKIEIKDIPNEVLRERVILYARVACDELAFEDRTTRVVSAKTRDAHLGMLQRYIGYLVDIEGQDISLLSIEEIFSRANLRSWVLFLQERQDGRTTGGVLGSVNQLRAFAVSFLGIHKDRFDNLVSDKKVERKSKAKRVPSLDDYHSFLSSLQRFACTSKKGYSISTRVTLMRLYTMLAVLNDCPLRAENICSMIMDHNLKRDMKTGLWRVEFAAEEIKARRPFSCPLSEHCQSILDHYLEQVRPVLLKGIASDYVFPTKKGKMLAPNGLSSTINRWHAKLCGISQDEALTTHLIRDMVTATCAVYLPQKGSLVAQTLLHHASLKTSDEHYLGEVARADIQRNERLYHWVEKKNIKEDDIRKILAEVQINPNEWRRLKKAIDGFDQKK